MDQIIKVDNQKRLTISDVANTLGVSKSTVSRPIGNGRISEATRKNIAIYQGQLYPKLYC